MSKALYRKYRSQSLGEIVGQEHITKLLLNALKNNKISHAYLLTGPRGVGKTSIARILAHEINKIPYQEDSRNIDIIEIDAASNNGVDDVRELREKVQIAPVATKKKIYIIDEVHMLSKPAFNALLKTLEEPPEHVVFILATTDAQKLPETITSRTQQFSFNRINLKSATEHLTNIAKKENIKINSAAIELIAEQGDGSFRDSINLLDQISGLSDGQEITELDVENFLGLVPKKAIIKLTKSLEQKDGQKLVETLGTLSEGGTQPAIIAKQLITHLQDNIISHPSFVPVIDNLMEVSRSTMPEVKLLTALVSGILSGENSKASPKNIASSATTAVLAKPVEEVAGKKEWEQSTAEKLASEPTEEPKKEAKDSSEKSPEKVSAKKKPSIAKSEDFSPEALLSLIKEKKDFSAIGSLLAKCSLILTGSLLEVYTKTKFHKKKLDDPRYAMQITEVLSEMGAEHIEIKTIASSPPPKDEKMAMVAKIMGGGEIVSL